MDLIEYYIECNTIKIGSKVLHQETHLGEAFVCTVIGLTPAHGMYRAEYLVECDDTRTHGSPFSTYDCYLKLIKE